MKLARSLSIVAALVGLAREAPARAGELADPAAGALVGAGSLAGGAVCGLAGAALGALVSNGPEFGSLIGPVAGGTLGIAVGELAGAGLSAKWVHRRAGPAYLGGLIGVGVGALATGVGVGVDSEALATVGTAAIALGVPVGGGIAAGLEGSRLGISPEVRPGLRGIRVVKRF